MAKLTGQENKLVQGKIVPLLNGRSKTPNQPVGMPKTVSNNSTFGYNQNLQQALHHNNTLNISTSSLNAFLDTGKMPSFTDSNPHSNREHHVDQHTPLP